MRCMTGCKGTGVFTVLSRVRLTQQTWRDVVRVSLHELRFDLSTGAWKILVSTLDRRAESDAGRSQCSMHDEADSLY